MHFSVGNNSRRHLPFPYCRVNNSRINKLSNKRWKFIKNLVNLIKTMLKTCKVKNLTFMYILKKRHKALKTKYLNLMCSPKDKCSIQTKTPWHQHGHLYYSCQWNVLFTSLQMFRHPNKTSVFTQCLPSLSRCACKKSGWVKTCNHNSPHYSSC